MPDLLIDTDVFIDQIRGAGTIPPQLDRVWYSVVTRAELFAGDEAEEAAIADLLSVYSEIPVDRGIAERAGRLRRRSAIGMPDALIAATALEWEMELVSRNRRDFEHIVGLRLRDPARLAE